MILLGGRFIREAKTFSVDPIYLAPNGRPVKVA
jgi:hypothetical protein